MRYHLSYRGNKLAGTISLPLSKSMSSRLLIINAIGNLELGMTSMSKAKDTQTLYNLLSTNADEYNVLDGGTTARFFTAYLAATNKSAVVTGEAQMKKRPIKGLVDGLSQLGGRVTYLGSPGSFPIKIHGTPLLGNKVKMPGDISSQFISALLLIAPALKKGLAISLEGDVVSKPYINMTLSMMKHHGIDCYWEGSSIIVEPGNYVGSQPLTERDWSSASYWYAMAALAPEAEITLPGLRKDSLQGDSMVVKIFANLGVETTFVKGGAQLKKSKTIIDPFSWDFSDCPDLAQTVITTCAALGITGSFSGLKTLAIKETDRVAALQQELGKIRVTIRRSGTDTVGLLPGNGMQGPKASFLTYNDHRMAMALSALCMRLDHVIIEDPAVVKKSYPNYWKELEKAGITIKPA